MLVFVALGYVSCPSGGDPLLSTQGYERSCKTTTCGRMMPWECRARLMRGLRGNFKAWLMRASTPTLPHGQPPCPAWVDLVKCISFPVESLLEEGITAGDGPRSASKCSCIFSAFIVSLVIASVYTKSDK